MVVEIVSLALPIGGRRQCKIYVGRSKSHKLTWLLNINIRANKSLYSHVTSSPILV